MNAHIRITVCAGCGQLHEVRRADVLTCSARCRVKAHRNGSLKTLRALARSFDIKAATILQAEALRRLRPDLAEIVHAGKQTLRDVGPDLQREFDARAFKAARLAAGIAP